VARVVVVNARVVEATVTGVVIGTRVVVVNARVVEARVVVVDGVAVVTGVVIGTRPVVSTAIETVDGSGSKISLPGSGVMTSGTTTSRSKMRRRASSPEKITNILYEKNIIFCRCYYRRKSGRRRSKL
jgi:hypothetical protein